jgi:predicted alpha/beta superfamily hydrolase
MEDRAVSKGKRGEKVLLMLASLEAEEAKIALANAVSTEYQALSSLVDAESKVVATKDLALQFGSSYGVSLHLDMLYSYEDHLGRMYESAVQRCLEAQVLYKEKAQAEQSLRRVLQRRTNLERRRIERKEMNSMIETFQAISETKELTHDLD